MRCWSFLILVIFLGFSCKEEEKTIPCDRVLDKLDAQLYLQFDDLQRERYELAPEQYVEKLRALRTQELDLYQQAKACEFEDPKAFNYWHSGRMKFPSRIEMELNQYE